MPTMTDKKPSQRPTTVEDVLMGWGELKYTEASLGRDAEEREWQEEALFYQRRQWLEWKETERRFVQLKPDKRKPRPMPVSNYYAKTINSNANQLGAQLVRVTATPKNDDASTRRAADYAEMAKDALDQESNLRLLNPLLAKHCALWGMGVLHDEIDTDGDQEELEEQDMQSKAVVGCMDCGEVSEDEDVDGEELGDEIEHQKSPCPSCGSQNTMSWNRNEASTVSNYISGKGKITSRVVPLFEIYLPRDCQNANLANLIIYKPRRPLSELRRRFGDKAEDLKADDAAIQRGETRMDVLKTLGSYSYVERVQNETATLTEIWAKWDALPRRLQEAIERELTPQDETEDENIAGIIGDTEDEEQPEDRSEELEQMKKYGMFFIFAQGVMLQWGANPFVDPDSDDSWFPFTFFLWDVDPASVYPKGVGADLVPLQKRLNRLDSLIELAMMTNAAGKWIWPSTQTRKAPTGDPSDVVEFDPIGDGKLAPQFVQPSPFHGQVWQYRAAILSDFQQLGLSLGVMEGQSPGSDVAFRTVAYLGAKASEQLNTQRYLWESAHCLHYKKMLTMAKLVWDDERQVKVAGPNGQLLWQAFTGEDLRGLYEIDFVQDSSVPKTQQERIQMLQQLIMAQLVDISDPQTRQYLYDLINMEGLNLAGELQFRKAERDLETIKRGEMPPESPYQDWQIALKIAANFTLTEEFEALEPQLQSYVLAYTEYLNEKMTEIKQGAMMQGIMANSAPGIAQAAMGAASKSDPNNQQLAKVPGQDVAPQVSEGAAASQGDQFAKQSGA